MSILKKAKEVANLRSKIRPPSPMWELYGNGPKNGVSYSFLSKFVVCRERTRCRYVEGLVPVDRKEAMEFGTIFHKALEFDAMGKTSSQIGTLMRTWSKATSVSLPLCRIAVTMVPYYKSYWSDLYKGYKVLEAEKIFCQPYSIDNKTIYLRGRRDTTLYREGSLWLLENKTKSRIDEGKIEKTLPFDLQTMLYMHTLKTDFPGKPLGGVLYNVIRKPQHKRSPKETENDFLKRIAKEIEKEPEHFFKIWEVKIDDNHLNVWRQHYLDPLLRQVIMWWESIKHNPFHPWTTPDPSVVDYTGLSEDLRQKRLVPNPHHWARPFGVYDPMSLGLGDYFDLVTAGRNMGLRGGEIPFPELQGEQGSQYENDPVKELMKTKEYKDITAKEQCLKKITQKSSLAKK